METHALADLEDVFRRITVHRPLFGQLTMQAHIRPDLDKTVVTGVNPGVVDG